MNSKSTATTFRSNPLPFKPRPPPNRFVDKFVSAPDKVPDAELVTQLFGVVSDGNFFEINKFIINNNMTLSVLNPDNDSLLHNVLSNTNLDTYEKTALAKQLIDRGSPVDGHNKNNITPMHLAAKYQLAEIIKILHQKGASLNVRDSNGMTPAHYIVRPHGTTCSDTSMANDRLIPDTVINLDDNNGRNTKIILETVRTYLDDDTKGKQARYLIENLKRTLLDINVNATPDIITTLDDTYDRIKEKFASGIKAGDKSVTDFKQETALKIQEILVARLPATRNKISNSNATWAPDDKQQIPLLPFRNISDGMLKLKVSIKKDLANLRSTYGDIEGKIKKSAKLFTDNMKQLSLIFNNILMVIMISQNTRSAVNKLITIPPNAAGTITITEDNISNGQYKTMYNEIFDTMNANGDGTNKVSFMGIDILEIITLNTEIQNNEVIRDINNIIFESLPGIPDVMKDPTHAYPQTYPLRHAPGTVYKITMKQKQHNPSTNERFTWFNIFTYFMTTLKTNIIEPTFSTNIINNILNPDMDNILTMDPKTYFENIITNYYKLLSASALLGNIYNKCNITFRECVGNLLKYCEDNINNRKNFKVDDGVPGGTDVPSGKIFKIYANILQNYNSDINRMISSIEEIYNNVHHAITHYNNLIDTINKVFGYAYIQKYFNSTLDNFDTAVSENIADFRKQLLTRINHVPLPPDNILSIAQLIGLDNYSDTKKSLLQLYGITQLQKTQPITYTDDTLAPDSNSVNVGAPKLGYLAVGAYDFTLAKDVNNIFSDDNTNYLSMGQEQQYDSTAVPHNYIAVPRTQNSGINIVRDSQDIVFPIVSGVLDTYVHLVKYSVIRLITKEMYNILQTDQNLQEVNTYIDKQMDATNGNNEKLIMSIIVNILEELFQRLITNVTGITAKKIMEYYEKGMYEASTSAYITDYISANMLSIDLIINVSSYKELYQAIEEEVNKVVETLLNTNNPDIEMFNQMISNFKESNTKEQHRILGDNQLSGDICFDIDIDATKALIACGADFTITDSVGNIPLNYAIDIGHTELVSTLLSSGISITNTHNTVGNTPIEHIAYKIREGITRLNINTLLDNAAKNLDTAITEKTNYPRILNRSNHILKFVIYLLNHQLTNMELSHFNPDSIHKWTYEDHTELYKILEITDGGIPLVNNNSVNNADLDTNYVADRLIKKKTHEKDKLNSIITGLTNERNNLQKYKDSLTGPSIPERQKQAQVTEYIRLLDENINKNTLSMTALNVSLTTILSKKQVVPSRSIIDKLSTYLNNSGSYKESQKSIVHLYEGMFKEINVGNDNNLKTDLNSYYKLWESILSSGVGHDNTQVPLLCIEHFKDDINIDTMKGFSIISKFWKNVLVRQIDDYFKLPRFYGKQNYLLDAVVEIYKHVFEHTLCANYYVVLFKLLINFVTTKHPDKLQATGVSRDDLIKNTMKLILLDSTGKNKLLKYIMETLPDLLVRSVLNIPKHQKDPIKSTNTAKLLNGAVDIILSNTGVTLDRKDQVIINIEKFIIPYFADYFSEYIKESHNIVNNYLKYIHSFAQDMEIYTIIDEKYHKEIAHFSS